MNKNSKRLIGIIAVIVFVVALLVVGIILLKLDVIGFLKQPMTVLMLFILGTILLITLFLKFGKK